MKLVKNIQINTIILPIRMPKTRVINFKTTILNKLDLNIHQL